MAGMFSRQHRTAGGRADRVAGVELGEADAVSGELIKVRGFDFLLFVAPQLPVTGIVSEEMDDVGFRRGPANADAQEEE